MKKYMTLLAAIAIAATIPANARKAFAELLGFQKGLFSNKVKVTLDLGQNLSFWRTGTDNKIVDENGKDVVFNSMVDAMNYMGERGWEFVQAYIVTEGNQNVYHWLMTKDVNSDEDIKAGLILKADMREEDKPTYILTFVKKSRSAKQWDVVKEETSKLSQEEVKQIADEWKAQTNDKTEYDVQVKKDR